MGLSSQVIRGLLSKGVVMGIVHVLSGPDHMSALATMTSGQSWHKAFFAGIRWGIGHSAGLIVIAIVFFALKGGFDLDEIGLYCDYIVGVLMIGLGLWTMGAAIHKRRVADRAAIAKAADEVEKADDAEKAINSEPTADATQPDDVQTAVEAALPTSEAGSEERAAVAVDDSMAVIVKPHVDKKPRTRMQWAASVVSLFHHHHHHHGHDAGAEAATAAGGEGTKKEPKTWCTLFKERLLAFLVGLVHGIAGPGGILGVLPAVEMHDGWMATIYLGTFCIMSDLTMGVFGALYGELTRRAGKNHDRLDYYLNVFSASLSLIVGIMWIVLHSLGMLEAVFE